MSQKFTLASNATAGDRLTGIQNAVLQLSTGDMVMLAYDPSQADPNKYTLVLVPGPAHTTPQTISTLSAGPYAASGPTFATGQSLAVCGDASDNIYVVGLNGNSTLAGSGQIVIQAYTKGSNLTWAAQTAIMSIAYKTGAAVIQNAANTGLSAVWTNDGGGTNGHGHITVLGYSGTTSTALYVFDAGQLLTGTQYYNFSTSSATISTSVPALYPDVADLTVAAIGNTHGMGVVQGSNIANTVEVFAWAVNSAGICSVTSITANMPTGTLSATTKAEVLALSTTRYAVIVPSHTNAGQLTVWNYSASASLSGSGVDSGTVSNFPTPAATLSWDAAIGPNGELYLYGWSTITPTTLLRLGYSFPGDVITLGAVATDDTSVGSGGTNSTLRIVKQPIDTTHADYQTYNVNGSTYGLLGDFSNMPSATTAPTLLTPANNALADLSTGCTFSFIFNSPSFGDIPTAYAFVRQPAGGAQQWWTGSAWTTTETFVSSSAENVVFPTGQWSTAVTYSWSIATKGTANIAGPYAGNYTVYSATGAPAAPSITATYDAPNNQVVLSITGTVGYTAEVQVMRGAGGVWSDLRNYSAYYLASATEPGADTEAPPNVTTYYQARQTNEAAAPYNDWSAWSASVSVTPTISTFWLREPTGGEIGVPLNVKEGTFSTQITENLTVHYPLGASFPIVLADTLKGEDGGCTLFTTDPTSEAALMAELQQQNTMLLQSNDGRQWYIRLNGPRARSVPQGTGASQYKEWAITWVQVATP